MVQLQNNLIKRVEKIMPAYTLVYKNKENVILKSETVMMKNLRGAKTSASGNAPEHATLIEIRDSLDLNHCYKKR